MKPHALSLIALLVTCTPLRAAPPEFELSAGTTGGRLTWHSHTFTPDGDFLVPKEDYVLDFPEQNVVSISLRWQTEPDETSGEFLAVRGAWRIRRDLLTATRYTITAERASEKEIVFTLAEPEGSVTLRSPSFPVLTGWYGNVKDLEKHISIVTPADLQGTEPGKPDKAVDPTP